MLFVRQFKNGKESSPGLEYLFECNTLYEYAKIVQSEFVFGKGIEYHIEDYWGKCLAIVRKNEICFFKNRHYAPSRHSHLRLL